MSEDAIVAGVKEIRRAWATDTAYRLAASRTPTELLRISSADTVDADDWPPERGDGYRQPDIHEIPDSIYGQLS